MFKSMKLRTKDGSGFALLIVIAVALGGLAVWSMMGVQTTTQVLSNDHVPAVTVGNQMERGSLNTMCPVEERVHIHGRGTRFWLMAERVSRK